MLNSLQYSSYLCSLLEFKSIFDQNGIVLHRYLFKFFPPFPKKISMKRFKLIFILVVLPFSSHMMAQTLSQVTKHTNSRELLSTSSINLQKKPLPLSKIMGLPADQLWPELVRRYEHSSLINLGSSRDGLYDTYKSQIIDVNKVTNRLFEEGPIYRDQNKLNMLSLEDLTDIQTHYANHPLVVAKNYAKSIGGGCFAWATIVHHDLMARGFNPKNIRKIWALGNWSDFNYHVGLAVPGTDGRWYVIDNDLEGPKPIKSWMNMYYNENDKYKQKMFLATPPERLGPGIFNYDPELTARKSSRAPLNNFQEFFEDTLEKLENNNWKGYSGNKFGEKYYLKEYIAQDNYKYFKGLVPKRITYKANIFKNGAEYLRLFSVKKNVSNIAYSVNKTLDYLLLSRPTTQNMNKLRSILSRSTSGKAKHVNLVFISEKSLNHIIEEGWSVREINQEIRKWSKFLNKNDIFKGESPLEGKMMFYKKFTGLIAKYPRYNFSPILTMLRELAEIDFHTFEHQWREVIKVISEGSKKKKMDFFKKVISEYAKKNISNFADDPFIKDVYIWAMKNLKTPERTILLKPLKDLVLASFGESRTQQQTLQLIKFISRVETSHKEKEIFIKKIEKSLNQSSSIQKNILQEKINFELDKLKKSPCRNVARDIFLGLN